MMMMERVRLGRIDGWMDGLIHLAEHDRQDASHRMNRCHRKGISRVVECQVRRSRSWRRRRWDSVRMAHSGALFRRVICSLVPQHPRAQTPSIERFLSGNRTIYYVHIFFRYIRNDTSYCEVEWIFRFLFFSIVGWRCIRVGRNKGNFRGKLWRESNAWAITK